MEKETRSVFNKRVYGNRLRIFRKQAGITQPALAGILGIHKNYVSNWETGIARPDPDIIPDLCRALNITPNDFFDFCDQQPSVSEDEERLLAAYRTMDEDNQKMLLRLSDVFLDEQENRLYEMCRKQVIELPVASDMVAAGLANPLNYTAASEKMPVMRDRMTEKTDILIRVTGDSMEPTYQNGDLLMVQYTKDPFPGDICIFVADGEGFVKEYRREGFFSHNSEKYPLRSFSDFEDIQCIGKVCGVLDDERKLSDNMMKVWLDLHQKPKK